jgi:hypothetical protein
MKTIVLALATVALLCAASLSNARYVSPGRRPPSLRSLHEADLALVVRLSADVPGGYAIVRKIQAMPTREGVFAGPRVKGDVLSIEKGELAAKEVDLPSGLHMIAAKKGEALILLVRETDGKRWISRRRSRIR